MARGTLLDIAKLNGSDEVVGLIEENQKFSPLAMAMPFRTIRGTSYKTVTRTGLPSAGFRSANDGFASSKSTYETNIVEAFIFGGRVEVDKAVADADEDGPAVYQAREASGMAKAAMQQLSTQYLYGLDNDDDGFPGLRAITPYGGTSAMGDALTIDAGGTTATTASSVYLIKFGAQDVQGLIGLEGSFDLPEFREGDITGENGNAVTGYISELTSWTGMQVGNDNAVRRIVNLTEDSGKGLTDDLLAKALAEYPVGFMPDLIVMSRRSRRQLQISRQVVLQGQGTNRPNQPTVAPIPTEYDGIPIVADDAVLNTDAIES